MEQIYIYTSRKKSFRLALLGLLMVAVSAWLLVGDVRYEWPPLVIKAVALAGVLFFGFCLFVALRWVVKNRLFLIVDSRGICVDPRRSPSERIEWKHIDGFSEVRIQGQKFIAIRVNNPDHWIEQEKSAVRRRMMRFNVDCCGSPFSISANTTRLGHAALWKVLDDSLCRFKAKGE